jgi:CHAT domain-containing protein
MVNFYESRFKGETMDKASALREAQVKLMNESYDAVPVKRRRAVGSFGSIKIPEAKTWEGLGFSHPNYWAPFVIMGNWK